MEIDLKAAEGSTADAPASDELSTAAPGAERSTRQEIIAALLLDAGRDAAGYVARYDAGHGGE